ncbi:serine 3-dehydrogenase [Acanthamoeba castellanii str. Neff]|uniref:Serine 3-dehydrogenase n=1 Tax=Acanthamoeba castellanii (strain ATCC 30010 / Neff) TaxID=1257118 RepID=L8GS19_ACACF|nr:serine 3-dehydrogenase [Acanthamoeba castellanii str. Neff]ELR15413.1 serine 3-dehydrogenase [Acanthamoeba castellanii str. Neff]
METSTATPEVELYPRLAGKVVLMKERLEQLREQLVRTYGVKVHTDALDVCSTDSVSAFFASLPADLSEIDVLVNNAGAIAALGVVSQIFPRGVAGIEAYKGGSIYCASKHAVQAITKSQRKELVHTPLRVTSICPGLVETEFSLVRFKGDTGKASEPYKGLEPLLARDVADAVAYAASRPPHVQVADLLIFPTNQASSEIVHRA